MLPTELQKLVDTFVSNIDWYANPSYNETQLRREFLDKAIKALGWDVDNDSGYAEMFKEVIHEDRQEVDGKTKAPDYCVQMGGKKLFFIEAKKPSVAIKTDISPAFQVRRYGWSAKLPLCILTDFQEWAIYDTTIKPDAGDNAAKARIFYCSCSDFDKPYRDGLTHWQYLESLFSKTSVMKGSLEKFKKTDKKRGTQEVDSEFLKDIETWRDELARNLVAKNNLGERELNSVVQKTIDRIIFLRICEDRNIERENTLLNLANKKDIYSELLLLFQQADAKYNSGLFHFRDERGNSEPADTLSLNVKISDNVLKDIIKSLYYPAPYMFSQMPADILGSVYERFLGKVIRLTSTHRAIIEDKPEVRKAGGVYYTPSYIVDYIVENTIGEQLKGKTPKTIGKFRVVDPACGSGSFLIVAYQKLLDWHLEQYIKSSDSYKKQLVKMGDNSYKLTIAERKRILIDHIFGVDIDTQAVEVSKLSLLLKTLEGITAQEANPKLAIDRILPNLSNNIKCGNSLIGSDFYNGQQQMEFSIDEQLKINVFDWESEFKTVFADGGFDAVIGNPPYETSRSEGIADKIKAYLLRKYQSAEDKFDYYVFFMERSSKISKDGGYIGIITPNTYFMKPLSSKIRIFLLNNHDIVKIDDFNYRVFKDASVMTSIIIYRKAIKPARNNVIKIKPKIPNRESLISLTPIHINQTTFCEGGECYFNIYQDKNFSNIYKRIKQKDNSVALGELSEIYNGIQTGDNKKFISTEKNNDTWQKILTGRDINRYVKKWSGKYIYYAPKELHSNQRYDIYKTTEKIIIRQTADRIIGTYDTEEFFTEATTFIIKQFTKKIDYLCLLGILNSNLFLYFYRNINNEEGRILPQIKKKHIFDMPILVGDSKKHTELTRFVDSMLKLKQSERDAKTPQEKTVYERQIVGLDREIDSLVYKLYDLTPDEIKIIEG